jgi:hypothetical protein
MAIHAPSSLPSVAMVSNKKVLSEAAHRAVREKDRKRD